MKALPRLVHLSARYRARDLIQWTEFELQQTARKPSFVKKLSCGGTRLERKRSGLATRSSFSLLIPFVIRPSTFVLRHSLDQWRLRDAAPRTLEAPRRAQHGACP